MLPVPIKRSQNQSSGGSVLFDEHPVLIHFVRIVRDITLLGLSGKNANEHIVFGMVVDGRLNVHIDFTDAV